MFGHLSIHMMVVEMHTWSPDWKRVGLVIIIKVRASGVFLLQICYIRTPPMLVTHHRLACTWPDKCCFATDMGYRASKDDKGIIL